MARDFKQLLSPEKKRDFNQLLKKPSEIIGEEKRRNFRDAMLGVDREFSQEGIPDFTFRADFSRRDNQEEREAFLNERVGKHGWTKDKYNQYALTPEGMANLDMEPDPQGRPTIIDEPSVTRYDVADLRGDAPAILGGTAAGLASTGMGIPAAIGVTGLSAAITKGLDEIADELRGENLQSAKEVAIDVAKEGGLSATGEGIFRYALGPLGRKLLAPQAHRMTPEKRELVEQASELGMRVKPTQVSQAPLSSRFQFLSDLIFGDPIAKQNEIALERAFDQLRTGVGGTVKSGGRRSVGESVERSISKARGELANWANEASRKVDILATGKPVIPTARLRKQAADILGSLPKQRPVTKRSLKGLEGFEDVTVKGGINKPIIMDPKTVSTLQGIINMEDHIPAQQMTGTISTLFDLMQNPDLVPGTSTRNARLLWKAAQSSIDDAKSVPGVSDDAIDALKLFRSEYGKRIKKFDDNLIARISREPGQANRMEPENIVGALFKKGQSSVMGRVMKVLPEKTRQKVRLEAMNEVLSKATDRTDEVLGQVFRGKRFLNALDGYGRETLDAVFGKQKTKELYRLGEVIRLVNSKPRGSGSGLVAAAIALHPFRNAGRLLQLKALNQMMNSKTGLKWLTEGLEWPNTRRGAAALSRFATQMKLIADEQTQEEEAR